MTVRDQLGLPHQKIFRLILTHNPARLVNQLKENHGEEWLTWLAHYLGECADFVDQPSLFPVVCQKHQEPINILTNRWLLSMYGRAILSHVDHIKASITSTKDQPKRKSFSSCKPGFFSSLFAELQAKLYNIQEVFTKECQKLTKELQF
eukprot:superscaffoldBa00000838_g7505